jgi:hypothetical protein
VTVSTVKEVADEHACGLAAQKRRPAHRAAARRGLDPGRGKQPPNRARRDAEAKLDQLASDPLIPPARVLAREPQHQFAQRAARRWTAQPALWVCPPPAHQLAMPAQQRHRRYHEPVSAAWREQSSKRGEERPIGGAKPRALMLTSQDRELVPKQHQFHILGELRSATANEQPQNSSKSKVGEGEEHQEILPEPSERPHGRSFLRPSAVSGSRARA